MPRHAAGHGGDHNKTAGNIKNSLRGIFTRNFNVVIVINLIVMTIYYLVFVTNVQFVMKLCHSGISTAGMTSGIMVIGCLVARFISGHLFSILGARALLFLGLGVFSLSLAAGIVAQNLAAIFICRFITGFGEGMAATVTGTVAASAVPGECRGLGISIFSISTVAALAAGPFLGILLASSKSFHSLFSIIFGISLLLIIIAIFLKDQNFAHKLHRKTLDLYAYIDPRAVRFSLVVFFVFTGYGCIQAYMATFAQSRGVAEAASIFFLVYGLIAVASRPITGHMLDSRGENIIIYPLFLIIMAGLVLLAYGHSTFTILLSGLLCGLGFGNFQSIGHAVAVSLVTPGRYAQATSTFFIFMDLGIGVGPYAYGLIISRFGYEGMYLALTATVLFAAFIYHFIHGRHVR